MGDNLLPQVWSGCRDLNPGPSRRWHP